jgi:hypothetical protein
VKISTAADFQGNRWTTNAMMLPTPGGNSYLLTAGAVMRLFNRHNGTQGVAVKSAPSSLDICASRAGDKMFLHVANMNYSGATEATFAVDGFVATGGRVLEISPENPRQEVSTVNPDAFKPREHTLPAGDAVKWKFPARSVSVVELACRVA